MKSDRMESTENWDTLTVTATAYNSLSFQTKTGNPEIGAWGDTLTETTRAIAVSRDLLKKGLSYNTPVKVKGLDEIYYVCDKMNARWNNKIDIFMGKNIKKARGFGVKTIEIYFLNSKK